jgi:L-alanine-DL-glutamate epimerase-like enolase superfamily enzyme
MVTDHVRRYCRYRGALLVGRRTRRHAEYPAGPSYIDALVMKPWRLDAHGLSAIPDEPGLGITLNPDAMECYTGRRLSTS